MIATKFQFTLLILGNCSNRKERRDLLGRLNLNVCSEINFVAGRAKWSIGLRMVFTELGFRSIESDLNPNSWAQVTRKINEQAIESLDLLSRV